MPALPVPQLGNQLPAYDPDATPPTAPGSSFAPVGPGYDTSYGSFTQYPFGNPTTDNGLLGALDDISGQSSLSRQERNRAELSRELLRGAQGEYALGRQRSEDIWNSIFDQHDRRIPDLLNRNLLNSQGILDQFGAGTDQISGDWADRQLSALNSLTSQGADARGFLTGASGYGGLDTAYGGRITSGNAAQNAINSEWTALRNGGERLQDRIEDAHAARIAAGGLLQSGVDDAWANLLLAGQGMQDDIGAGWADRTLAGDGAQTAIEGGWGDRETQLQVLQDAINAGYDSRVPQLMALLDLRGREASENIDRAFNSQSGNAVDSLANRGLYNTTVLDSVERGIREDQSREHRGLAEQLRESELGLLTQLTAEQLAAEERGLDRTSQFGADVLASLERGRDFRAGLSGEELASQERGRDFLSTLSGEQAAGLERGRDFRDRMSADDLAARERGRDYRTNLSSDRLSALERSRDFRDMLLSDQLGARERGIGLESALLDRLRGENIGVRSEYDASELGGRQQALSSLADLADRQRQADTALGLNLSDSRLEALRASLGSTGAPSYSDLVNLFLQSQSDVPVPVSSGGSLAGLIGG